jgi:hypothetical protein
MFISRIGLVMETISEQGRVYLSKLVFRLIKCKTLLIDLVNYSRTVKGDKVFWRVNLNDIVKLVIDDLSSDIEDKSSYRVGTLPIKNVFSNRSTFVNLISNA